MAFSKVGAKLLQGPHQGAQQSTSTGSSLWLTVGTTFEAVNSIGLPLKMGFLHFPQLGLSVSLSEGSRLVALHFGQVTLVNDMTSFF